MLVICIYINCTLTLNCPPLWYYKSQTHFCCYSHLSINYTMLQPQPLKHGAPYCPAVPLAERLPRPCPRLGWRRADDAGPQARLWVAFGQDQTPPLRGRALRRLSRQVIRHYGSLDFWQPRACQRVRRSHWRSRPGHGGAPSLWGTWAVGLAESVVTVYKYTKWFR